MKARIEIGRAIEVLQKNLDGHAIELVDATDVWVKDAVAACEKMRDAVDRQGIKAGSEELWKVFHARPEDNRLQYGKFLGMLKRAQESGESHIEVDEDDYDCIFQDNWTWRQASKLRNTSYSSRKPS
jgi:hypothetical protein